MKKITIAIIILVIIIGLGVVIMLTSSKECAELGEEECKKADNCLSVLVPVPCESEPCSNNAIFKECKDKSK